MRKSSFHLIPILSIICLAAHVMAADVSVVRSFPLDGMENVLTKSGLSIDADISSDGKGALRIVAEKPKTVRLFEVRDIDVENARLIYQARMRTDDLDGTAYLEMWCHFPGKGAFFSRDLKGALRGTTDWTTVETPFFLKTGQKPDFVLLNVVVDGAGTVRLDDVKLLKAPLK